MLADATNPLMNGTKLFLNALLILLYICFAIFAAAAVGIVLMGFLPQSDIGFTASDNVMAFSLPAFLAVAIFFFRVLRDIVQSVADGDPFNHANPYRLAQLAWLSLALWGIDLAYLVWDARMLGEGKVFYAIGALATDTITHMFNLVGPISLFILARVFRHGAAMREDLEGTV